MEVKSMKRAATMLGMWAAAVAVFVAAGCGEAGTNKGGSEAETAGQIELPQRTMPVPAATIEGKLDQPNVRIELRTFKGGRLTPVMKVQADAEGSFTMKLTSDLAYDFHQLVVNGAHPLALIMDDTYGIRIDASVPASGYITDARIEGSPESALLAEYYNKAIPLQMQLQQFEMRKDRAAANATRKQLQDYAERWVTSRAHLPSAIGAIEHLDPERHKDLMVAIMNANRGKMGTNEYFRYLENNIVNKPKPRRVATPPPASNAANGAALGPGDAAPDIVMAGLDGQERKLSDLRGKVVLIDFWASWCGPCRRENPHVVNAYRQYGPKGFEVFSVSLDKTQDKWEQAIAQDGLVWPNHVSDLAGWGNAAARLYGVNSIPHTVLIDADGNIIARNLRGRALTAQLAQLFP